MAHVGETVQDEDAAELTFPKEFENAETLLISEVRSDQYISITHLHSTLDFNLNSTSFIQLAEIVFRVFDS